MIVLHTIKQVRDYVGRMRADQARIAFVPTMGNLHQGHLRLVAEAQKQAEVVVVSIFVNPTQFGVNEDFASYPRTLDQDLEKLRQQGTQAVFTPSVEELYPRGPKLHTQVEVTGISAILCGVTRPTHFAGVATVVNKLLNIVMPDSLYLGKKDFQQLRVVESMVADLDMPVQVFGVDTVREADGLAMSSRNQYLSIQERETAAKIFNLLIYIKDSLVAGDRDFNKLEQQGRDTLEKQGFRPDYVSIRCARDLALAENGEKRLVVLIAAYLGRARLIDNMEVVLGDEP